MKIYNISGLFDTHAHLTYSDLSRNIDQIVQNAKTNGLSGIYNMSTELDNCQQTIDQAKKYPGFIYSFVGIDPEVFIPESEYFHGFNLGEDWFENSHKTLENLIEQNKEFIAGIGETGMDLYWLKSKKADELIIQKSQELQERLFRLHLELAQKYNLPLSIHSRGAEERCLEIVKGYSVKAVFHCYTGELETAKKIMDSGNGIGLGGIFTFKNASNVRNMFLELFKYIGEFKTIDDLYEKGIYLETDSPFLAPEGKRGEMNKPENVKLIWENILLDHK